MVEKLLQIGTILKNKANLQRVQMSISLYEQKDYEEKSWFWLEKNKANFKNRRQKTEDRRQKNHGKRYSQFFLRWSRILYKSARF